MKIVFHDAFYSSDYASDAAAAPGRMEAIMSACATERDGYEVVTPQPASREDLLRAHAATHVSTVEQDAPLFAMASLAAGGAIRAAELAVQGEPAFACVRPPGHHASVGSAWGYCAFCNVAIGLLKLRAAGAVRSAFVLDFDAHTGDGTIDVLSEWAEVQILNPFAQSNRAYLDIIERQLRDLADVDIVAVSAGFDSYVHDVGKKLTTFDFYAIGVLVKQCAKRWGHSRRFAVLEGGYYQTDLGKNALAFCQGLA